MVVHFTFLIFFFKRCLFFLSHCWYYSQSFCSLRMDIFLTISHVFPFCNQYYIAFTILPLVTLLSYKKICLALNFFICKAFFSSFFSPLSTSSILFFSEILSISISLIVSHSSRLFSFLHGSFCIKSLPFKMSSSSLLPSTKLTPLFFLSSEISSTFCKSYSYFFFPFFIPLRSICS